LSGFFIAPEGLAVPFAERWSDSAGRAGLLLSAVPLGSAVGVYVLVRRIRPARRMAVAAGMAVGCGVPLFVSGLAVSYPAAFVCWFVSGLCAAYQVEVLTKIVQAIPDELRAGAIGICNAILLGAQGLGVAAFGKVGDVFSPAKAVAAAGLLGAVAAGCLVIYVRRASAVPA
jgi:predicted MFS family arabinose efflux permease